MHFHFFYVLPVGEHCWLQLKQESPKGWRAQGEAGDGNLSMRFCQGHHLWFLIPVNSFLVLIGFPLP